MALTKPGKSITMNDFSNILRCKMHAYISFGTLAVGEKPATLTALTTLLSTYFQPLGDLAKDPIEYGWKRDSEEVHAGKKRGLLNVEGVIKSINLGNDMINLLDESGFDGDCTVAFIPFGNPATATVGTPAYAIIVRGVSFVDNGKGNGNKKFGEVGLEFNVQPDKIADALWKIKLTS